MEVFAASVCSRIAVLFGLKTVLLDIQKKFRLVQVLGRECPNVISLEKLRWSRSRIVPNVINMYLILIGIVAAVLL